MQAETVKTHLRGEVWDGARTNRPSRALFHSLPIGPPVINELDISVLHVAVGGTEMLNSWIDARLMSGASEQGGKTREL